MPEPKQPEPVQQADPYDFVPGRTPQQIDPQQLDQKLGNTIIDQVYRDTLLGKDAEAEQRLSTAMQFGWSQKAEQAARVVRASMRTGLPEELVQRNLAEIETLVKIQGFNAKDWRRRSPIVAAWIAEKPEHAALVADDLETMGYIEGLGSAVKSGFRSGVATTLRGQAGLQAAQGQDTKAAVNQADRDMALEASGGDTFQYMVKSTANLVGNMAASIPKIMERAVQGSMVGAAAGAAASAPTAGIASPVTVGGGAVLGMGWGALAGTFESAFNAEAGNQYLDMKKIQSKTGAEIPEWKLQVGAYTVGLLNATLETASFKVAGQFVAAPIRKAMGGIVADGMQKALVQQTVGRAVLGASKEYAKVLSTEVGTELAQEGISLAAEELAKISEGGDFETLLNSPEARSAAVDRMAGIFKQTLAGMVLMAAPGVAMHATGETIAARRAMVRQQALMELSKTAGGAQLNQRVPEKMADIMRLLIPRDGNGGTMFFQAEEFADAARKSNMDPVQLAREMGVNDKEFAEAMASGGHFTIPTSEFATKVGATTMADPLSRIARFGQDAMSVADAEAVLRRVKEVAAEVDAQGKPMGAEASAAKIRNDVVQQLLATGMDQKAAESQGLLYERFFGVMGERAGVDPFELYQRYDLRVNRPLPGVLTEKRDVSPIDSMLDRVRTGQVPGDKEVFGPSLVDFLVSRGGIQNEGGELAAMDARFSRIGLQNKNGMSLDMAAMAAVEAGYPLSEATPNALLDAVRDELQGYKKIYNPANENANAMGDRQALQELGDYLASLGIDPSTTDNETIKRVLAEQEAGGMQGNEFAQTEPDAAPMPDTIEVDGKQRPTLNSNGKRIARTEEAVRNFWKWFGDSKVVDEQGRPLVVYHGSKNSFDVFDNRGRKTFEKVLNTIDGSAFFTSLPEQAGNYAEGETGDPTGAQVYPVYLNIRNPAHTWATGEYLDDMDSPITDTMYRMGLLDSNGNPLMPRADLKENQHDGIINEVKKADDGWQTVKAQRIYVTLRPEQIKSATGNRGTFDPANPSILNQLVSTRFPTAVKATENPLTDNLIIDLSAVKADPDAFAKNAAVISGYPGTKPLKGDGSKNPDRIVEAFIKQAVDNLLWLHDQVPSSISARSKLWYDGARAIATRWAAEYNLPDRNVAAVLATLSPQKDWYQNVSLAKRVLDVVTGKIGTEGWTSDMDATAARIWKEKDAALLAQVQGKRFADLTDDAQRAMWVRTYDEAHGNPAFPIVTPEGDFGETVKNAGGKSETRRAWGDLRTISKAVRAAMAQDQDTISILLGNQHKVRNFYNNIFDPNSADGHVTIDTHAVAAALLRPLAGGDVEVEQNFGGSGAASSSIVGSNGTYGIYAEAYRRAAEMRGILPREMQSITWEAVRGLFTDTFKTAENKEKADAIWRAFRKGEVTLNEARSAINRLAGGIEPPTWWRPDLGVDAKERRAAYQAEVSRDRRSRGAGASGDRAGSAGGDQGQVLNQPAYHRGEESRPQVMAQRLRDDGTSGIDTGLPTGSNYIGWSGDENGNWAGERTNSDGLYEIVLNFGVGWEVSYDGRNLGTFDTIDKAQDYAERHARAAGGKPVAYDITMSSDFVKSGTAQSAEIIKGINKDAVYFAFKDGRVPFEPYDQDATPENTAASEIATRIKDDGLEFKDAKNKAISDYLKIMQVAEQQGWSKDEVASYREVIDEMRKIEASDFGSYEWTGRLETSDNSGDEYGQSSYEQGDEANRGRIILGRDGKVNIELLRKADLSTFLHESGHFFLEVFGDLAQRPDAPEQIRKDYQAILDWFGVKDRSEIKVEHHEAWARGFEQYLMEGKAPSPALRSAFARFRAWLVSIYKQVAGLRVNLSDEVRGVMDRMVATQEEIDAAQARAKHEPLFVAGAAAAAAGMSPEQAQAYLNLVEQARIEAETQLTVETQREYQREREAWWREELAKVTDEVRAEVDAQPAYQALAVLQRGLMPDGSLRPIDAPALKLSLGALEAMYGPATRKKLDDGTPANRIMARVLALNIARREGGVEPRMVSEMLGFSSVDDMVMAMVNARPRKEYIAAEADRRMRERHGDMLTDGTLADKAMSAVLNDKRSDLLMTELRMLARKAGRQPGAFELLRQQAEEMIARKRVMDLAPDMYRRAAAKASKAAFEAAAKGDWEKALREKQKEFLNNELHRLARDAREEVDGIVDRMRGFTKPEARKRLGKAGSTYLEQIDSILERFNLSRISNAAASKKQSLREWLAEREAAAASGRQSEPVPEIPDHVLDEARRQSYKELTVEELRGVDDSVRQIAKLAALKNKLLKNADERDFETVKGDLLTAISANVPALSPEKVASMRGAADKARHTLAGVMAAHRKIASWARQMDGDKDGGAWWSALIRPLNEAADSEVRMKREAAAVQKALWSKWQDAAGNSRELGTQVPIPGLGVAINREAALVVALNWGNEDNRARVLDGGLVAGKPLTEPQVRAILATLDDADWDLVEGIWKQINGYWPEIAAKERRVQGIEPKKVEALPFQVQTANGTTREISGGYYPIKYDTRMGSAAQQNEDNSNAKLYQLGVATRATTKRGHVKERGKGLGSPVLVSLDVVSQHLAQVIHDLTHHEAVLDLNKILADRDVSDAIRGHLGPEAHAQMKRLVQDVAVADLADNGVDRFLRRVRNGVSIATMGFNVGSALMQSTGIFQSMRRIGVQWFGVGFKRMMADRGEAFDFVKERSSFMRDRATTQMREASEVLNQVRGTAWKENLSRYAYWMMTNAQQMVDMPTWLGAYEKALNDGRSENDAVAIADQAVIDAQGSGLTKDLAGVQRSRATQLLTVYYSYFSALFNQTAESWATFRRAGEGERAVAAWKLATDMVLLYALPAATAVAIRGVMAGGDDDKPDAPGFASKWLKEMVGSGMGTMIGVRELSASVTNDYGYRGPAGMMGFEAMSRLIIQAKQGELDKALFDAAGKVVGVWGGLPTGQVVKTIDGIMYATETGELRPILFGVPPKK